MTRKTCLSRTSASPRPAAYSGRESTIRRRESDATSPETACRLPCLLRVQGGNPQLCIFLGFGPSGVDASQIAIHIIHLCRLNSYTNRSRVLWFFYSNPQYPCFCSNSVQKSSNFILSSVSYNSIWHTFGQIYPSHLFLHPKNIYNPLLYFSMIIIYANIQLSDT